MTEERLRRLLREAPVPDEDAARERAWRVVGAAFERRASGGPRGRVRRWWATRPAVAAAAVVCAGAAALTPPGEAVGEWISDAVRPAHAPSAPALTSLPAAGQLLVSSASGVWVVQQDGSKRRLGRYDEAGWSPGGLYVIATRDRQLVALEPDGDVRWTLSRPAPVSRPAWAPDGLMIAYLTGGTLRVVEGDGAPGALVADNAAAVTPGWRPGAPRSLAYADRTGAIALVQTDTGRTLWRARAAQGPRRLLWTPDGRRLVAVSPGGVEVFAGEDGRRLARRPLPAKTRAGAAAIDPSGRRLALVRYQPSSGRSQAVSMPLGGRGRVRELFPGRGRFSDLQWSPDGRWLLVAWRDADQWLFVSSARVGELRAVSDIGRQFDPGGAGVASFPGVSGWCCGGR